MKILKDCFLGRRNTSARVFEVEANDFLEQIEAKVLRGGGRSEMKSEVDGGKYSA